MILSEHDDGMIALMVSTQPEVSTAPAVLETPSRIVQLAMRSRVAYRRDAWLSEFLRLTFEEAAAIAGFGSRSSVSSDLEQNYSHFLDVVLPKDHDAVFALRLLCEAWRLGKTPGRSDIKIWAPDKFGDWLEPFSKNGNAMKPADVVALMAGAKEEAKALFLALAMKDGVDRNGGVDRAVAAFLQATQPRTEGG
jgi:hypothetical protein